MVGAGPGCAAHADSPAGRLEEAGDDVEQCRLAATRWTQEAEKLGGRDVEADAAEAGHAAARRVVDERDVADLDMGHKLLFKSPCSARFGLVVQKLRDRGIGSEACEARFGRQQRLVAPPTDARQKAERR